MSFVRAADHFRVALQLRVCQTFDALVVRLVSHSILRALDHRPSPARLLPNYDKPQGSFISTCSLLLKAQLSKMSTLSLSLSRACSRAESRSVLVAHILAMLYM